MLGDLKWVGIILVLGSLGAASAAEAPTNRVPSSGLHDCEEIYPGAPISPFTPVMCKLLKTWPPSTGAPQAIEKGSEWLRVIRIPGHDRYVGLHRVTIINAPLSKVVALNENYENYPKFLSGVKECKKLGEYGNWTLTRWIRNAPKSFLPDLKFDQMFYVDKRKADRIVFKYQITQSEQIPFSDGLIVLEPIQGGRATRVTSFDFVKPDVSGFFWMLIKNILWNEAYSSTYRENIEFKLEAEHPGWDLEKVKAETQEYIKKYPLETTFLENFDLSSL